MKLCKEINIESFHILVFHLHMVLHQEIAPAYSAKLTTKLMRRGERLMSHTPHSPDFASYDFFPISNY